MSHVTLARRTSDGTVDPLNQRPTDGSPLPSHKVIQTSCPGCQGLAFRAYAKKGTFGYLRCQTCGLLALDPMPSEAEIAEHYRVKFQTGNYAAIREFADQYRPIYRQYMHWMERFLPLEGARTLDIGCFTGELLDLLVAEARADAYGVELQEEAAAIAEARCPGRVFRHNIDRPSDFLREGSFEAVTMMGLIEHVQEPGTLLVRARALLKPGGWLFLQTPNASSVPARMSRSLWPPLAPVEHLHLFSEPAITQALNRSGFEVRQIRAHVKRLPLAYVHEMLRHFGPEWRRVVSPFYMALPRRLQKASAWFYAGEMLIAARAGTRSVPTP
jgi:2-polyprenyl-3-methyl-5-hydroxy-6-metoxy-1,4-benzoquinol methylase